jgi:hypothetical protein
MKFLQKNWLYILLFVVLLAIIIYLFFRKKSTVIQAPDPVNVLDPVTNTVINFQPGAYTNALWDEMDRNSFWSGRNLKPYQDFLALSDGQIKAVVNDWNARYFSRAGSKTLAQRIAEEKGWAISGDNDDNEIFPGLRQAIISKIQALGLV